MFAMHIVSYLNVMHCNAVIWRGPRCLHKPISGPFAGHCCWVGNPQSLCK